MRIVSSPSEALHTHVGKDRAYAFTHWLVKGNFSICHFVKLLFNYICYCYCGIILTLRHGHDKQLLVISKLEI